MSNAEVVNMAEKKESKKKTDNGGAKKYFLSKEEVLEIQNLALQEQLLTTSVQKEMLTVQNKRMQTVNRIAKRLSITDIENYKLDATSGELTYEPPPQVEVKK